MIVARHRAALSDPQVLQDHDAHEARRQVGMLFRLAIATLVGEVYVAVLVLFLA